MSDLFGHDLSQITLDRQIKAAERELGLRQRVYPRRVSSGAMSQRQADEEIAVQRAIIESLHRLQGLETMSRVLLHFRAGALYAHAAEAGVEIVCVDEAAPGDRIYISRGRCTPDEFDALVDKAIRGDDQTIGGGL